VIHHDPKSDPVHEARRLGTVLLVVRMSNGISPNILPPPPPPPRSDVTPLIFNLRD